MVATLQERIALLIHWQRQLDNARSAAQFAERRGDAELAQVMAAEARRAEMEREAAILAVGAAAGATQ
jgi:hypothetical protein